MAAPMPWIFNDGGREAAGYKGFAGDCVTRAIAIAGDRDYLTVRGELMGAKAEWRAQSRSRMAKRAASNSVRGGTPDQVWKTYLLNNGWQTQPLVGIGTGAQYHLSEGSVDSAANCSRYIARISKHLCAVVNGVVHDVYDPSRGGTRMVYALWYPQASR